MAGDYKAWKNISDDKERYAAYLCSREWSVLRRKVHKRSGGTCERCKILPVAAVHHLTYARKYNEQLEDLAGWCKECHEFTHGKHDFDPADTPDEIRRYLRVCQRLNLKPFPPCVMCGDYKLRPYDTILCAAIDSLRAFEDMLEALELCPVDVGDAAAILNSRLPFDYRYFSIWIGDYTSDEFFQAYAWLIEAIKCKYDTETMVKVEEGTDWDF
jgi:hypothetical protein